VLGGKIEIIHENAGEGFELSTWLSKWGSQKEGKKVGWGDN